jgi:hypothetical protein
MTTSPFTGSGPTPPLQLWGGVECTVNRVGDSYHDQLELTGHAGRIEDLQRVGALGIRRLRYPVLWERVAPADPLRPDWRWVDRRLARLRSLGIAPIAGLVHHGSGPPYAGLLDDNFAVQLAAYLTWLLETFVDYRLAVELRHRSWSDDFGPTLKLLNEHDAAFVQIDEPKFKTSIRQNQLPNITSFYYLRAHGRNWKKWWHHEHKDERYDYLYKPAEIQEFGETLKALKKIVRKAYAYMNNHADAKSVANAIELKHFLGEPVPENLHQELLRRYPALKVMVPVKAKQNLLTPVRKR